MLISIVRHVLALSRRALRPSLALSAAAGMLAPGCATLHDKSVAPPLITINSEPSGADVFVGDRRVGVTPSRVRPSRVGPTVVRLEMAGFVSQEVAIPRAANPWLFGNLIFANPLGCQGLSSPDLCPLAIVSSLGISFGVDLLTGAAFRYVAPLRVSLGRVPRGQVGARAIGEGILLSGSR